MLSWNGLPEVFTEFLSYKLNIQNCSKLTAEEYLGDLRRFFVYTLAKRKNLKEKEVDVSKIDLDTVASVKSTDIYQYLLYLAVEKNLLPATRTRKLATLKSFFKYFATKVEKIEKDPTLGIDSPKLPSRLPIYMSHEEANQLLASFDPADENYYRDYLIVVLFLATGVRLSELVGLNLSDINISDRRFVVRGKGNKTRELYFPENIHKLLLKYLTVREKTSRKKIGMVYDKDALFLSNNGRRISNKTVQYMLTKQLAACGLDKKGFSAHKLRHTAATLLYNEKKVDVLVLKEMLGHSQLSTTQIYTHVNNDKVRASIESGPFSDTVPQEEDVDDNN